MLKRHIATLGLLVGLGACGDSEFDGNSGSTSNPGKSNPSGSDAEGIALVDWEFACDSESSSAEVGKDQKTILKGPGPHSIVKPEALKLRLKGRACNANSLRRDVVFVIDVSGSMVSTGGIFSKSTDPMKNGTCERMKAVSNVIDSIKGSGNARFGLVTFEGLSTPKRRSTKMYSDVAELYRDFKGSASSVEQVVCAGYDATNYDAGLKGAADLLAESKEDGGSQEIYFISDGEPQPSSANGKAIAAELRKNSVIATVMIGSGDDTVLKNDIASKDKFGDPLHSRADYSNKLSEVLARLATNNLSEAIASVQVGGQSIDQMSFLDRIKANDFNFEAFEINIDDVPTGFAVELSYKDRYGKTHLDQGQVQWTSEASAE